MQMGIHRLDQPQLQLIDELDVTVDLLDHRIDDQRLAAATAGKQVSIGAGHVVEELAEDHEVPRSGGPRSLTAPWQCSLAR
jgi:hypothetical protein